ncbi:MAG: thiamine phosphate synthase [Rikenellaceae bacterium]
MLQFITHYNDRYDYVSGAREALAGGCRWIQLRVKDQPDSYVEPLGRELLALCREFGATFIIDDRVELVRLIGADGVHLGKNDMSIVEARRILGAEAIIGGTANRLDDIVELDKQGANYIGLGPFRYTTTKSGLSPILGLEGYREIVAACRERGVDLPIVAIGGITAVDVEPIVECGVTGVALSGTILGAESPRETTQQLIEILSNLNIDKK